MIHLRANWFGLILIESSVTLLTGGDTVSVPATAALFERRVSSYPSTYQIKKTLKGGYSALMYGKHSEAV